MQQVQSGEISSRARHRVRNKGSAIVEFAPAVCILICGVMLPLLDLGFIPIRYAIAHVMINHKIGQLALEKSAGDARRVFEEGSDWRARLASCGIRVKNSNLSVVVADTSNQQHRFMAGQKGIIPGDLLPNPDPEKPRLIYRLEMSTNLEI